MNYRFSTHADVPQLLDLWNACFPNDGPFPAYYFKTIFAPENALVAEEGDRIVAMLHLLPRTLSLLEKDIPAAYVFAVGTLPGFRGQGIAGGLLDQAFFELHLRKIPIAVIVPQEESLFHYYGKYGFSPVFSLSVETIEPSQGSVPPVESLPRPSDDDIRRMNDIYTSVLRYRSHVRRSPDDWQRIIENASLFGGGLVALRKGGTVEAYGIFDRGPEGVRISEAFAEDEDSFHAIVDGILSETAAKSALFLSPACNRKATPFGMARVVDAFPLLELMAAYTPELEATVEVVDDYAIWNNRRYQIADGTIDTHSSDYSGAAITAEQLTSMLFSKGALPYMNLMFN